MDWEPRFRGLRAVVVLAVALAGLATASAATPPGTGDSTVVITEIMTNPSSVADEVGEWFELHNPGPVPVSLDGWEMVDGDGERVTLDDVVIGAGGYVAVGRSADPSVNGGFPLAVGWGDAMRLLNAPDRLVLLDDTGREVDQVDWSVGFPWPRGRSMSLVDPAVDNADGRNWCLSTTAPWGGDLATPGSPNRCDEADVGVVVSEVLADPEQVADAGGEWFELHNRGTGTIDLLGFVVKDDDTDRFRIDRSVLLPAGGRVVLGSSIDPRANGGVSVAFSYGNAMRLQNGGDELVLLDPDGVQVDRVAWADHLDTPRPSGASIVKDGGGWCVASAFWASLDRGTPGQAGGCAGGPSPAPLTITEVMRNPTATGDDDGEWLEVHNPTDRTVDLLGWHLSDDDGDWHRISSPTPVPAGGFVVLGRTMDATRNGGSEAVYTYGSDVRLSNDEDELVLSSPDGIAVDRIEWDETWPGRDGGSMSLRNATITVSISGPQAIGNSASGWCASAVVFGAGDRGTPGAPTICATSR